MLDIERDLERIKRLDCADTPRARLYSAALDDGLEAALAGFDRAARPFGDPAETDLRTATALTGLMAFCHANPRSRYHGDPWLLEQVRARLLAFAATQDEGSFTFRQDEFEYHYTKTHPVRESHGNSWYLEPLIYAAWWVGPQLDEATRATVRTMVQRAAWMHAAVPLNETNNRGVIRCAILALAGRFLGEPALVDLAIRDFHREPARVFNAKDGQINEGTGPDGNYSGTTFVYCYTYRLFSGDATIDRQMVEGLRWYSRVSDRQGYPTLMGVATRMPFGPPSKVLDFLPAYERYAPECRHFGWLVERYYLHGRLLGPLFHVVSPAIWAMLEHDGQPGVEDPGYYDYRRLKRYNPKAGPEFMYSNEGYAALHFIFRADYHSSTAIYGRAPFKGLQHWAYCDEPPVVWPTESHASKTLAWGVDTSVQNASGIKFRDKIWYEGPPHVLVCRWENVWHHYVLTRTTVLLLISASQSPREDLWVIAKERCGTPTLADGALTFAGQRGRLHLGQAGAELRELANAWHLRCSRAARTHAYAFSNESFRWGASDPAGDRVCFRDDTGAYELAYELRFHADDDTSPVLTKGGNNLTGSVRTVCRRVGE